MKMRFLAVGGLAFAALLAGCASPGAGTAFTAPAGWAGSPGMFGRMQIWVKPAQQKDQSPQMLFLIKTDPQNQKKSNDILSDLPAQYSNDLSVVSNRNVNLCGTQPAQDYVMRSTDKKGEKEQIEMVATVIGQARYVAFYVRPQVLAADAAAESSLHSLCPVK